MKKFFGFARRKSSSSLKGLNPRRFSIGSSASSTLQIQVVRGGYNVDLGKVDSSFTKLHKAALLNDEDKVKKHIKNLDVNSRDSSGRTPLHLATVNGNLKLIRTLIEAGANVNAQDADGKTPIVKAIECNHEDLVQFFLCVGADTAVADFENGNTPLHWALSMGAVKAAQYLLRNAKQLDVNQRNNQNETCLHLAVKLPQLCVILEDLIANGTQLEAKDDRGKTALVIATTNENTQAVNTLLKYGSNTYSSDEDMRHSIKVNRNNLKNIRNLHSHHETDSADSWPDTEDEDSNYERPVAKESNKPRKESFKSNSFRVSSLVDETIVEELKTDDNNSDDYVICKPSTSREENVGDITEKSNDIKLIWNKSSSSDEDINSKVMANTPIVKTGTDVLKPSEEVLEKNAINEKQNQKALESDPFNIDVMDELEMLLQETVSHERNVDFISQMKNILDEDPPEPIASVVRSPPTQPTDPNIKPVVNLKSEPKVEEVIKDSDKQEITVIEDKVVDIRHSPKSAVESSVRIKSIPKLKRESNAEFKANSVHNNRNGEGVRRRSYTEFNKVEDQSVGSIEEQRRRSYAEVVAQRSFKRQAFMDELKNNISVRAKSYADVVSTSSNSEFEQKETKIPILRANPNSSPIKQNIKQFQSISPKHNNQNNSSKQMIETNNAINSNSNNNNKSLSKIPLPVKQSSSEQQMKSESNSTTSEESILTEDYMRRHTLPAKPDLSESLVKSTGKAKSGAIRSSKLRRKVNELNDELKKGLNEKSLLASENESIKRQLMELNNKIREESDRKFDLEKKLIKLESELNQYRFECEMKCKENNAIKSELELIVNNFEDNQKECRYLNDENQKMINQIKSMKYEEEVLTTKLRQQAVSPPQVCNHEDLVIEWKSKVDELTHENERLRRETEELQKESFEKQLEFERELFEWQKRNLEIDSDLKRLQLEIQVNAIKPTPEEQIELLKAVRDLNLLMVKLDDRITRNEENQQFKARNLNEEMFDCARNLLDQMRLELTNFKDMLSNTSNKDNKSETEEKQLTAFESRILELRSSLERLEDQIQSQELQLIRQSDIISFASPLRKSSSSRELFMSSNNKPKSWFVQTLFRLQSHIQSTTTGDSISAFAHQKTRLQKQIHELKSELGIFAESVH